MNITCTYWNLFQHTCTYGVNEIHWENEECRFTCTLYFNLSKSTIKKNKPVITGILNGVKKNENSKSRINKRLAAEL